jgi:hypothetical protein
LRRSIQISNGVMTCPPVMTTDTERRRTFGSCWQVIFEVAVGGDIPFHRNTACKLPCQNITLVEEEDKFHLGKVTRKSRS